MTGLRVLAAPLGAAMLLGRCSVELQRQRNVARIGSRRFRAGVEALYTSLERATAEAEADYVLAVQRIPPKSIRTIHRLTLSLEAVIDLRSATALALLGVQAEDLMGDDYRLCQAIGGAAAFLDIDGLIVASARVPGANLVVLFLGSGRIPVIEVLSSEVV